MIRGAVALTRAGWRSGLSYRVRTLISVASILVTVLVVYFVSSALQPTMAASIRDQGGVYFGFLIMGMVTYSLVGWAVHELPNSLGSGIRTGTLEALFATPTRLPELLAGLTGYGLLWTVFRNGVLLGAALVLGMGISWSHVATGAAVLFLIVLAYVPIGLLAGASVVAFRTSGPLPEIVTTGSALLGGVYYPTHVIPSWIQHLSGVIPLTYGLRALRETLLEGRSLYAVRGDLLALLAFLVVLSLVGVVAFVAALRYARRSGTLAQY